MCRRSKKKEDIKIQDATLITPWPVVAKRVRAAKGALNEHDLGSFSLTSTKARGGSDHEEPTIVIADFDGVFCSVWYSAYFRVLFIGADRSDDYE
jgi:hypothetical protein